MEKTGSEATAAKAPRIVTVLKHKVCRAEANNAGFSSENKSKCQTDVSWKPRQQLTTYSEHFPLMKHLVFLQPRLEKAASGRDAAARVVTLRTESEVRAEMLSTSALA